MSHVVRLTNATLTSKYKRTAIKNKSATAKRSFLRNSLTRNLFDSSEIFYQDFYNFLTVVDDTFSESFYCVVLFSNLHLCFSSHLQIELENLNSCTDDINKLEIELEVRKRLMIVVVVSVPLY